MAILSKIIRYILLLIIFNANISLLLNKEKQSLILLGENEEKEIVINFKEKGREEETCIEHDITNDEIGSFNITEKCVKATIKVKSEKIFYMTIFPLTGNMPEKFENLEDGVFQLKINTAQTSESIDVKIEKQGKINFFKVEENAINKYYNITSKNDTSQLDIKDSNNIIRFLDKEEQNIRCKIKFNQSITDEIAYGFIDLPSNKIKFMPQAFLLNNSNILDYKNFTFTKISNKDFDTNKLVNPSYNKDYKNMAFIVSLKTQSDYTIIINEDLAMTYFLICSIVLALIFAIITFFLIRRKQNIPKDPEPDIYDENQEEENSN